MESQLKMRICEELRRAANVKKITTEKISDPFKERIYRVAVPEQVERELLAFPHKDFFTVSESFIVRMKRTSEAFYIRLPAARFLPTDQAVIIQEGTELDQELKAAVEAANVPINDKLNVLDGAIKFVGSCADHRELYQLWPGVTRYMRGLYLGRTRKWPTRVKSRYKRKLTEEEKLLLGKFTLMIGTQT